MKNIAPTSLRVEDVRKTYPNGIRALDGVSLEVRPGEVFGLVGPNGAGKTTLLKLASGLLFPESGRVCCGDTDVSRQPKRAARFIGLMPDPLGVYTDVSAVEYLEFFARALELEGVEMRRRIDYTAEMLELGPWLNEEVETLSAGWQRRLALGRVLLADVPILLLDEPAAGLDISARRELLGVVRKLAEGNRAIVVSSHILPELQQLADRFAILNKGRWVNTVDNQPFFTRERLEHGFRASAWRLWCGKPDEALRLLSASLGDKVSREGDAIELSVSEPLMASQLLADIVRAGIDVFEFKRREIELTDVVLDVLQDDKSSAGGTGAAP